MPWPSPRSIRTQLLLLVMVALVPAMGILIYRNFEHQRAIVESAQVRAQSSVQDLAEDYLYLVEDTRQLLATLAQVPEVQRGDFSACNALFAAVVKQNPNYTNLLLVDAEGMVRASGIPFTPFSVRDRKYVQRTLATGKFSAGELVISRTSGKPTFHFALPLSASLNTRPFILAASLDLHLVKGSFDPGKLAPGSCLCTTDHKGMVIHALGQGAPVPGSSLPPAEFQVMAQGRPGGVLEATGKESSLVAFEPLRLPGDEAPFGYFRLTLPKASMLQESRSALTRDLIALGMVTLLSLGGALLLGKFLIVDPLDAQIRLSQAVAGGRLKTVIHTPSGTSEFEKLGQAFAEMAITLGRREEELKAAEARTRAILDTINEAVFIHDADSGAILQVSNRAGEIYGYQPEEMLPLTVEAISSGRAEFTQEHALQWMNRAKAEGPQLFTWEGRHRDGHCFPVEVSLRVAPLDGQDRVIVSVREIAARLSAEQALQESEARFQLAALQTRQIIYEFEPETGIVRRQGALTAITGEDAAHANLTLTEWSERIHPEDRGPMSDALREAIAAEGSFQSEYRFRHRNGQYLWLEDKGTFVRAEGKPLRLLGAMSDITERRAFEQAFRDQEKLLNLFFAQSLDGFYIMTLDEPLAWGPEAEKDAQLDWVLDHMRMNRVNGAMAEQYGTSPESLIGRSLRSFYAHDEVGMRPGIRKLLDHGRSHQVTNERTADGTEIWIEGDYLCLYTQDGRLSGHFGVQRDISSRMQAERDLRLSEQRFRAVFDHTFQFLGLLDPAGTMLQANQTSLQFAGIEASQVIGKPFWETPWWSHDPAARELAHDAVLACAEGRFVRFETTHLARSGEIHSVDFSLKPVMDEQGQVILLIPEGRDISELRRSEAAYQEKDRLFRLLFDRSGDPGLLIDGNLFVDCNLATVQMLGGRSRDEVLQTHPSDLSPEVQPDGRSSREKADEMIAIAFERGSHRFEWVHRRLDGSTFPVDVRLTAVPWEGRWILHTTWRDLTEREHAEADRRSLESQVLQAQKLESLGVLAGGIAHDFNNLLTAILGNLNLAETHSAPEHPSRPYLETAERTVVKAAELTQQMLAYSGRGQFVVRKLDLSRQVEEMANLLQVSLPKKVVPEYRLGSELPVIEVDIAQLQQVVLNLVTNAAEAIGDREGHILIVTSLALVDEAGLQDLFPREGLRPGRFVTLEVSDTGCGMSPAVLARVFDPFYTTKKSGRGLGLSAMLGILRGHGAGLQVSSTEGHGSTFKVFFPAQEGAAEARVPAPVVESRSLSGTVLVVDDEPTLRETCAEALKHWGFEVIEAADGQEAVDWVKAHPGGISMVLMDLTMPRLDGREAFLAMRRLEPNLKVILSSGYSEQESLKPLLQAGLFGFLQKPYTLKELRRLIQEALTEGP